ncbi:MAG: 4a-hydroxytetrahydrobiopterin dehydratase [Planctomycetota bacterium]
MTALGAAERTAALRELPDFVERDGALRARYRFADFAAAFAFVTAVANDAEAQQHHPDWSNSYAVVTIALRTHDAAAITERDVRLARCVAAHARAHGGVAEPVPADYPRDLPPMWFLLALLAVAGLHHGLPSPRWVPYQARLAGPALALAGVLLVVWGAGLLHRRGTGVRPFTPATALVPQGPFRFSRNPIYLGLIAIVAGAALGSGTPWPWPIVVAFALLLDRRFVRREEQFLAERFGDAYAQYRRAVRRWL